MKKDFEVHGTGRLLMRIFNTGCIFFLPKLFMDKSCKKIYGHFYINRDAIIREGKSLVAERSSHRKFQEIRKLLDLPLKPF